MTGFVRKIPSKRRPLDKLTGLFEPILQVPPITDYTMEGRTYRYYKTEPLYPFGYGLSYSKFLYQTLRVQPRIIQPGEDIQVTCQVKNVGRYDAEEVSV